MSSMASVPCPSCGVLSRATAACALCGYEPAASLVISVDPAHADGAALLIERSGLAMNGRSAELVDQLRRGPIRIGEGLTPAQLVDAQAFFAGNGIPCEIVPSARAEAPAGEVFGAPSPAPTGPVGGPPPPAPAPPVEGGFDVPPAFGGPQANASAEMNGPAASPPLYMPVSAPSPAAGTPGLRRGGARAHTRRPTRPMSLPLPSAATVVTTSLGIALVGLLGVLGWQLSRPNAVGLGTLVPPGPSSPARGPVQVPTPPIVADAQPPALGSYGITMEGAQNYGENVVLGFQLHYPQGVVPTGDIMLVFDTGAINVGAMPANVVDSGTIPGVVVYNYRFVVSPPLRGARPNSVQVRVSPYVGANTKVY